MLEVTSRFGQRYECLLPTQGVKLDISSAKDDKLDSHSGNVSELLQPMESEACLTKKVNWWTYEFCYGKSVKQYHMEGTEIQGEILRLGLYQSDFTWGNSTLKESRKHRLQRYHSQRYVNGTPCDLNGKARETEVRFTCEDGVQDYLHSVSEPESCVYILWVRTARICQHPMLRPPRHPPSLAVTCHPALSATQYEQHLLLRHQEEEHGNGYFVSLGLDLYSQSVTSRFVSELKHRMEQKEKERERDCLWAGDAPTAGLRDKIEGDLDRRRMWGRMTAKGGHSGEHHGYSHKLSITEVEGKTGNLWRV
uniref:Endoplasmic reticulum lectin n=1 Tax=Eptatretus burgeri TaxID=7764 RepID=A0A8C4PXL5_EPTBU